MVANRKLYVLASGGFDSTFRLCELSFCKNTEVVPVYLYWTNRISVDREFSALSYIVEFLQKSKRTKALIQSPQKIVNPDDLISQELLDAYYSIMKREKFYFSMQYVRAAAFALQHEGAELCYEKYYLHHIENMRRILFQDNAMVFDKYGVGHLDRTKVPSDFALCWGHFGYPLIMRTKFDLYRQYKNFHYESLFPHLCSCRKDFGEWCGYCVSCKEKMQQDFYPFFSKKAKKYYMVYKILCDCYPQFSKIYSNYTYEQYVAIVEDMLDKKFMNLEISDNYKEQFPVLVKNFDFYFAKSFRELVDITHKDFECTSHLLK